MTIDELVGRLETAAGEVLGLRAELERLPPAPVTGVLSREVLEQVRQVWLEQHDLAAQVGEEIRRLAGDVALASRTYRAVDFDEGRRSP
jgi:hypothetical protein